MKNVNQTMREYHRYLGFFLAGIMAIYAVSGVLVIFWNDNFLALVVTSFFFARAI